MGVNPKEQLFDTVKKKLMTAFIGAIDELEKSDFSQLWGGSEGPTNGDQKRWKRVYQNLRREILNNGNDQIRDLVEEFVRFDVKFSRYKMTLPYIADEEELAAYKKQQLRILDKGQNNA